MLRPNMPTTLLATSAPSTLKLRGSTSTQWRSAGRPNTASRLRRSIISSVISTSAGSFASASLWTDVRERPPNAMRRRFILRGATAGSFSRRRSTSSTRAATSCTFCTRPWRTQLMVFTSCMATSVAPPSLSVRATAPFTLLLPISRTAMNLAFIWGGVVCGLVAVWGCMFYGL